ncbi:hypothetical protein PR001_g5616 [Phytophthora rubi]|uniref:Uncharacterized protein n=1 Tax=Phytophthora rubi TaxID=129364 RepID=A0A6A3NEQ0_9STRA|nr:hypothetical protein PR001_g5616 [Phytophthora rubi]
MCSRSLCCSARCSLSGLAAAGPRDRSDPATRSACLLVCLCRGQQDGEWYWPGARASRAAAAAWSAAHHFVPFQIWEDAPAVMRISQQERWASTPIGQRRPKKPSQLATGGTGLIQTEPPSTSPAGRQREHNALGEFVLVRILVKIRSIFACALRAAAAR